MGLKRICLAAALSVTALFAQNSSRADATLEFHSGFWMNLHHFLYEQATRQSTTSTDAIPWRAAVGYYQREVVPHDVLSRG